MRCRRRAGGKISNLLGPSNKSLSQPLHFRFSPASASLGQLPTLGIHDPSTASPCLAVQASRPLSGNLRTGSSHLHFGFVRGEILTAQTKTQAASAQRTQGRRRSFRRLLLSALVPCLCVGRRTNHGSLCLSSRQTTRIKIKRSQIPCVH